MRFRFALLRLLLSLALVVNGTSAVYANARMAFGAGTGTATADHKAEPACHDMADMQDGTEVADHDAPLHPARPDDCCPPGACLGSCVSHAPTILTVHAIALTTRPVTAPASARHVSHATPALPHLIRPPIG